jgi:hypothetical protein
MGVSQECQYRLIGGGKEQEVRGKSVSKLKEVGSWKLEPVVGNWTWKIFFRNFRVKDILF